jgi:mono/diheme cytochrome c family protein
MASVPYRVYGIVDRDFDRLARFEREAYAVAVRKHSASAPEKRTRESMFPLNVILLGMVFVMASGTFHAQAHSAQKPVVRRPNTISGKETFVKFCAVCHGEDGKGNGPAAAALKPPPTDLTTLSKTSQGKYPAGFVSAVLKFGRNLAAHGSEDMPVWGSRFRMLDPMRDPTGQRHVDDVVAYIESIQTK